MQSRREFHAKLIGSAITFGLVEMLWSRDLFADPVKPTIDKWFVELAEMTKDLKGRSSPTSSSRPRWKTSTSAVDLKALCSLVKLDEVEKKTKLPDNGAANVGFDLSKVEGLPANVGFGKQIFGCKKGRSIVPHGHANMCTGFIVLKGKWHGKHYDRVETHKDHYVIKPTIDRDVRAGRALDDLATTRTTSTGSRRESDAGVHLQRPRHRLRPDDQGVERPALPRSGRREARRRADQGAEDDLRGLPQEVRVKLRP